MEKEMQEKSDLFGQNDKTLLGDDNMSYKMVIMDFSKDEYYTPSIEDLRVGYECELFFDNTWHPNVKLMLGDFYTLDIKDMRTPYLTKEQIESEGWRETDTPEFFDKVDNDRYYINWESKFKWLSIGDNENENGYSGPCPSINELRYITKLLKIK